MKDIERIAVIGAGSWGTALAMVLAHKACPVYLWTPVEAQAKVLAETRRNPILSDEASPLADNIIPTCDIELVKDADLFVVVVPSVAMRSVAQRLNDLGIRKDAVIVSCTKGIEQGSHKRMSEILQEYLPENPIGVLSGPNHAEDICMGLPSASLIGFEDASYADWAQQVFSTPTFRVYSATDIIGMQLGGTIKNVFAIGAGLCEGLNLGDNAQAAMLTRGLAEMTRIGVAAGGKRETFMGLSGVGDLIVTCYSHNSRNQTVGRRLASGQSLQEILDSLGMVAEGVPNTLSVYEIARELDIRTPLIDAVYAVLYESKSAKDALVELMSRDPRPEQD
ncbi:MAG: NAD(P)H-dependent glycerol-3-phosphate dehydrogenase [Akkermansia sp.]|nr:NAD(P)H-dependent glycerol-3-phosphate dehydrogenase [Akkermansia sp.]